jgi:hypothetical protein
MLGGVREFNRRMWQKLAVFCTPIQDVLLLGLLVLFFIILYIPGLGFYSDDWGFLGTFATASHQSFIGLISALGPGISMRPIQGVTMVSLYQFFGFHPLGYHLCNSTVFLAGILLFHQAIRELDLPRSAAVAAPALYAFLPNYSTDRFWFAAFQSVESMAFYFLSLYAALRVLRASPTRRWRWVALSLVALVGSALAYEVFLPMFLLNLVLVARRRRALAAASADAAPISLWRLNASHLLALGVMILFKWLTTTRITMHKGLLPYLATILRVAVAPEQRETDYGLNIWQAIRVNYGLYGVGLPRTVGIILRDYSNGAALVLAAIVGLLLYAILSCGGRSPDFAPSTRRMWLRLTGWGFAAFVLGYAIFLTNMNIQLTPSGIGNRTAIAAAIGVALSLTGSVGWISTTLPRGSSRQHLFSAVIAVFGASACLTVNTLASFWHAAYEREQVVLTAIRSELPTLPHGTTLILDGVCPYMGPAVVFESSWDLAGALKVLYRDPTLRANTVTPRMRVEPNALTTKIYSTISRYPYSDRLLVYDFTHHKAIPLPDAHAAFDYFATFLRDPSRGCPRGHEGVGVRVF